MRKTALWFGALMIGMIGSAEADDHGFYMDVAAGVASYPADLNGTINRVPYTHDGHTSDFTYSFAVGYRINRYFGVEAGFADFGNPFVDLMDPADPKTKVGRARLSGQGKSLAFLTHIPTGDWDTFVRVGALHAVLGTRFYIRNGGTSGFDESSTNEGTSLLLGIGTRYAIAQQWAVGFSVDYYGKVGGEEWADVVTPRVGFSYRF
jgi:hypothetical protein